MKLKSLSQKDRYGNMFSVEFFEPSIPSMMLIPEMERGNGYNGADTSDHPGDPKGTDTVPAWLTPGENVVNAEASRIPGNQEMIDEMNDQGRAIQQSQGGPIPTYEADGGIIPPMYAAEGTLPLGLRQNNPGNIRPGADFIGESGANDGYAVFDSEEEGLRAIQKLLGTYGSEHNINTLEGFANRYAPPSDNNPTSSYVDYLSQKTGIAPDEEINLADRGAELIPAIVGFEQGQMPYTEDQIRMAIEMAGTDDPEAVKAILDGVPPTDTGLMSAEASTVVPKSEDEVPPSDEGNWYDFLFQTREERIANNLAEREKLKETDPERYARLEEKDAILAANKVEKARPPIRSGLGAEPYYENSVAKYKNSKAQQEADAKVEELSVPPRLNDGTIPGMDESSSLAKQGERMRNDPVENAEERVEITEDYIRKYIDAGLVPPESVVNANKSAKTELEKVTEEEKLLQQENIAKADAEAKAEKERLDSARAALGLPPTDVPIPELDGVGIPEVSTEDESKETQAKKNAAMTEAMKGFRGKTFSQPSADELKEVERLGSSPQGKGFGTEVAGYFKQMFKDLFSGPELARMAVMYAGSRLMGYDHGGSLQYSMTQYIDRVDSDVEARKKFVTSKDALEDYTGKSLQAYRDSGNLEDLVAKGKTLSMTKPVGNSYLPGIGKVQRFEGSDGNEYVEYQGKMTSVNSLAGFLEPWDESVHGREARKGNFESAFTSATDTANSERGLRAGTRNKVDYDDRVAIDAFKLGGEAESRFREILNQNGVSINDVPELEISVNNAITKFVNDTIDYKKSGGKGIEPKSIRAYINNETRSVLTGVPQYAMNGTSDTNMNQLDTIIKKEVRDENGKRLGPKDRGYAKAYEEAWSATWAAYQLRDEYPDLTKSNDNFEELAVKKNERKGDANKWTAFTLWASRTPGEEVQAIIEQAILDDNLDKLF